MVSVPPQGLYHMMLGVSVPQTGGSIVMILATDAPLNSRQLHRLAKRATHGLARTGSFSSNGSGDFVVAFSTANRIPHYKDSYEHVEKVFYDASLSYILKAAVESVEEAILNALFMAETVRGRDDHIRYAITIDAVLDLFKKYGKFK